MNGGMNVELKAILFDTRSIQKYIFSGNKLKTNIGASYLVDRVFDDVLISVLDNIFQGDLDKETFATEGINPKDWDSMTVSARIGYIGGGNALVVFRNDVSNNVLENIVKEFSKRVLVEYPGLHTGAAIGNISINSEGEFTDDIGNVLTEATKNQNGLTKLVQKLKKYQSTIFPNVNIPYTGLTLSCDVNDEVATSYSIKEKRFYSWDVAKKMKVATTYYEHGSLQKSDADKRIIDKLSKIWSEKGQPNYLEGFCFPTELSKLGQKETEDYIAVCHIDGNNMGSKFAGCKNIAERKDMSLHIKGITVNAFAQLTAEIIKEYPSYDLSRKATEDEIPCLPIRPLVLGGDDMTFVCNAKLALRYTERIMMLMNEAGIDSCGGMAIIPSAYPFFRGYELAEQLCDAAKEKMRHLDNTPKSCWLDFALLHGEQAPTLKQIRDKTYSSVTGHQLHFGPYRVDCGEEIPEALVNLKNAIEIIMPTHRKDVYMPMNKIKEMRNVLTRTEHERVQFIRQLEQLNVNNNSPRLLLSLPDIPAWQNYTENLWYENKTPYLDMIEMIDYYFIAKDVK